jgi:beta-glucosidase
MNIEIYKVFYFLIAVLVVISCSKKLYNLKLRYCQRLECVDSVMKLMTLEEKIGQLNQYNGLGNHRTNA